MANRKSNKRYRRKAVARGRGWNSGTKPPKGMESPVIVTRMPPGRNHSEDESIALRAAENPRGGNKRGGGQMVDADAVAWRPMQRRLYECSCGGRMVLYGDNAETNDKTVRFWAKTHKDHHWDFTRIADQMVRLR